MAASESRPAMPAGPDRSVTLAVALIVTMMASTLQLFVVAVGASKIIADLDISRTALGLATAMNTAVGALVAPRIGRVTDRIGSRLSVILVMMIAAGGLAATASATSIWILAVASMISGIPDGWGNPATNKLIADRIPPGRQGRITGIKQSGVQLAVFATGLMFPSLADWTSWRSATWIFAGFTALCGVGVAIRLPAASHAERADIEQGTRRLDPIERSVIHRLAWYALLLGISAGAFGRWLPLFGEEELGMSARSAGLVVALMGVVGIGARIMWGSLAETRIPPLRALRILAVGSIMTLLLSAAAPTFGSGTLWVVAILAAFSLNAWNAVAMLTVITAVPRNLAGRASGPVLLGFLGGLSLGSPLAGWAIDELGDYRPVWLVAAALALAAATLASEPVTPNG